MSAFIIRDSEDRDVPAITQIYGRSVETETASFELAPPSAEEMARRRAVLIEQGFPYVVAERDGQVLGYAYASAYRPRPAYRFAVENSVYVAETARRQGISRALMMRLIEECAEKGYRQMIAVIGGSDHIASIEAHRAAGFETIGAMRDVGYKFGRWLDTVIMQRPLGPGAATLPED